MFAGCSMAQIPCLHLALSHVKATNELSIAVAANIFCLHRSSRRTYFDHQGSAPETRAFPLFPCIVLDRVLKIARIRAVQGLSQLRSAPRGHARQNLGQNQSNPDYNGFTSQQQPGCQLCKIVMASIGNLGAPFCKFSDGVVIWYHLNMARISQRSQ
jgi:hypothetical protein